MIKIIKKILTSIIFQHILFWVVVGFILIQSDLKPSNDDKNSIILNYDTFNVVFQNIVSLFFTAIAVYINLLFLIPIYLRKKQYFYFIFLQIINVGLFSIIDILTLLYLFDNNYNVADIGFSEFTNYIVWIISEMGTAFLFIITTTFLKLLRDWLKMQDNTIKIKEMERQRLEAELNSLKSQINPHFLFNTLNNLYSLSLDNSPRTPDMILKLSDLMRYIIYECRENRVPLSKEIEFTKNYLSLEKLRLGESVNVSIDVKGSTDILIAPLLFINFLENAFKHGKKTDDSFIMVDFDLTDKKLIKFTIENSIYSDQVKSNSAYSGIGIVNAKKRLEFLYPNCHEIIVNQNEKTFKIELKIQCYE